MVTTYDIGINVYAIVPPPMCLDINGVLLGEGGVVGWLVGERGVVGEALSDGLVSTRRGQHRCVPSSH